MSYEKIVLWFLLDEQIFKQLDNRNNTDIYKYSKVRESSYSHYHEIYTKPSYILYQIVSSEIFKDYLVWNEKLSTLINHIDLNLEHELFLKYEINRADIESVLLKMGAVDRFENLSMIAVRRILKNLSVNSPEGKQTLSIYKLAIKHYEKNNQELNDDSITLYATQNNVSQYFNKNEIYYNGNIKLPKKLTDTKAILNYPRRQSTKNIVEFFGINNLNTIHIDVLDKNIIEVIASQFNIFFEQIKPLILVYRIKDIEDDKTVKNELNKLKKISISLCDNVAYKIDEENFSLENNDYIKDKDNYFVKISRNLSLEDLRDDFEFSETFADIIGLVFDIQDTKIFRDMIKDELQYIEKIIRSDIGSDELVRAREFLGISDEYYSFWKTIYTLLDKDYIFISNKNLLKSIKDDLHLKTDIKKINYSQLSGLESGEYIESLFIELGLSIDAFNKGDPYYKIDLSEYHIHMLGNCFKDNFYKFKQLLYKWCQKNSSEKQFLNLLANYEHQEEFINGNEINLIYQDIVENFVKDNFDFSLVEKFNLEINFNDIYENNKAKIDFEKIEDSHELRSLLYFENKIEEIQQIILKAECIEKEKKKNNTDKTNLEKAKKIVPLKLSKPKQRKVVKKSKSFNKTYKYSQTRNKQNKDCGDAAERAVFKSLIDLYGSENVVWNSNDFDTLKYDLRYRNEEGWKYVEVKTYSNDMFHLTTPEKEFADKNKGSYEIFLVDEEIYQIIDIDFMDTDRFILTPDDYLVFYSKE